MSEAGYVELPVIKWLSGYPTPAETGLGWTYRDETAMAAFDRPLEDPLVEKLLVAAILKINSHVKTDAQAKLAVAALRRTMSHPDKLTANRQTLDLLRDGAKVVLTPGEDAKTVQFIAFEPDRQHLNDFTATNQYRVQGVRQCRDDTALLVNGIPLVIAEYKSYLVSSKDWREAVHQLHRYQRQAPLMLAPNVFCVAADEEEFRYGTILFHDASKEDIEIHMDNWGRWLSLYPDERDYCYALTMRAKLRNAFRFGFTGTPIDKTMKNTHRDFGPVRDGEQERYISYYGIRRAIKTAPRSRFITSATRSHSTWTRNRRRLRGSRDFYGELAAKTRLLIQENTSFLQVAESLPVFRIDENYVARLDDLPSSSDKAAALEAALTVELSEDDPSFIYRMLGERLQRLKERKDAGDQATEKRLRELEAIAAEAAKTKQEPERLNLKEPGEYGLFTVLKAESKSKDEAYLAECARRMVAHLRSHSLLTPGWSNSTGGIMRVEQSLLAESWNDFYRKLGFDPESTEPTFLKLAIAELAKADSAH